MLWRRVFLLALTVWASRSYSQERGAVPDITDLIRQAFDRNREILAAQQRVAEARGLLRQAGVRPAPTLETSAETGRPLGTHGEESYAVGYFRPIETGGKRPRRLAVAEAAMAAAQADLDDQLRRLAFDIKSRHVDAVAAAQKAAAIQAIVEVNRESHRLTEARVQREDAAPLEAQLLLVELNRTEAQRLAAAGQAQAAELELRRAVGIDADRRIGIAAAFRPAPAIATTLDDLRKLALGRRSDLLAARALASQAEAEVALAQAQGAPDLTVSAQYTRRYSQFEDPIRESSPGTPLALKDKDNTVTVGVSIPLQTRKRNAGNIEAAVARQRAASLRAEQIALTIPMEVEAAWRRFQAADASVQILRGGVLDASEKNLSVIRQAYQLGQLRLFDVLNEQRRLLDTRLSYIDAEAELSRSLAELERAAGGDLQ